MENYNSTEAPCVAVLGGTGFVGRALVARCPKEVSGRVTFLVHRSTPAWLAAAAVSSSGVDLEDVNDVRAALDRHDVLINLLRPDGSGWYPEMLQRLQPIFERAGIRRCVHASSIDVYSGADVDCVDEETPPRPRTAYEAEHLAAEGILAAAFPETVVLRLGAVFGAGGRNVVSFAEEMRHAPGWKLALRRALYGDRRMHLVSVETVADALLRAALTEAPLGSQVILVTEDSDPDNNFAYVQDRLAEAFGRASLKSVPVLPRVCLRLALKARGLPTGAVNRRFSSERGLRLGVTSVHFRDRLGAYARLLAGDENGAIS
ncbi:MAG: NAD-dependent epimerase/dehydratase family protein [Betaproteobacteria bacterium]|nr:NAD-dependent epimerase/dehydratase family protein [Betaproteobacteria bacterium]